MPPCQGDETPPGFSFDCQKSVHKPSRIQQTAVRCLGETGGTLSLLGTAHSTEVQTVARFAERWGGASAEMHSLLQ